jgi:hypothetical protein
MTLIAEWINRAIGDLSIYFPVYSEYSLDCEEGIHIYDMEPYIKGVFSVEYPTAQEPPRFLSRKTYTDPKFWLVEGYYDFLKPQTSNTGNPPQLYISDNVQDDEVITVKVSTDHSPMLDPGDECSVLDRHIHLIGLFVVWKAYNERAALQIADPSPLNTVSTSLMLNAIRAEASYKAALSAAIAAEAESAQVSWKMDRFDAIY